MEKVGPISPPHAAQMAAKLIPLGKGWVLEPIQTGYILKALALGAQIRITADEAQSLRDGQILPQDLAARYGMTHPMQPPPAAITIAFSDEARRLAGTARNDRGAGNGQGAAQEPPGMAIPLPSPLTMASIIIAIAIVILATGI